MKHLLLSALCCYLSLVAPAQCLAQPGETSISGAQFDAFLNVVREPLDEKYPSSKTQSRAIQDAYTKYFAGIECGTRRLTDTQVRYLFRAANQAEFYTHHDKFLEVMARCLDELVKRGQAQPFDYSDLYGGLVQLRSWKRARQFAAAYPKITFSELPKLVDDVAEADTSPTALFVAPAAFQLIRKPIDTNGFHLFVVAHPLCHFSQNAIRAVEGDPELKSLFDRYAEFITPPARSLDFMTLRKWNLEHQDSQMSIAYSMKEWSFVDYWGTPTFYFMRDGKVLKRVVGWPGIEQAGKLLDAFHQFTPRSAHTESND